MLLYRRYSAFYDDEWLVWADGELQLAKEAMDGKWKERITFLEGESEQQKNDMQTSTKAFESTIASLQIKVKRLEEQIHEKE